MKKKTKKTTREWFQDLPVEIRDAAIRNTRKSENADFLLDEFLDDSLAAALIGAFPWDKTEEGFDFWSNIYSESSKIV